MWIWIGVAAVAILRILVIWSDDGIYPGLPGDFIPLSALLWFFGGLAVLGLALAMRARRRAGNAPVTTTRVLVALLVAPALIVLPDVVGFQFGRWSELHRELVAYDRDVKQYVREHGPITTEAEAQALRKVYPSRPFAFGGRGPEVLIVYRWWWGPNARVLIIWGRGASAAFDLRTMICDYTD